jgi:hypothetical protein
MLRFCSFARSLAVLLAISVTLVPAWCRAQVSNERRALLDPRSFGFDIPAAAPEAVPNERVVTHDEEGQMVVARTHAKLGDHRIVMLPEGQLVARGPGKAEPSQRPFEPISKEKLIARLRTGEFKDFKVKQTKHYIYLYSTSDEFAFGTGKILESMLPGVKKYMESMKLSVHEPDVPLVVIMFKTEDDFQRYRRMPDGVVAYYHTLSNQVVMFEESRRYGARRDLAIQQAISTIAHEGTHQILHNIGVQQRLSMWPMWLSEGLAEFLAPTSVGKKLTWKGAAQVNDMRMFELEQYLKSRAADNPNGDTITAVVQSPQLTSTGYAAAWSLTHYLATKRRAEFIKYLAEVAKTGPLEGAIQIEPPGVVPANLAQFEKCFGDEHVELEKKLVQHLQKLPYTDPFAGMPHFVAMLTYQDGKRQRREVSTFHSPVLAAKWVQETCERNPAINSDEAVIRDFPNRLAAETFARAWLRGN